MALGSSLLTVAAPYRWHLPADAGAHGPALDQHLVLNLWIAFALLILAHVILLAGTLLRRRGPEPPNRHSGRIQYVPLVALSLLFVYLAVRAERLWAATRYTGASPEALQVEIVGQQFVWQFRYPGADAIFGRTAPELVDAAAGNPLGIDPADRHGDDDLVSSELVVPADREVDLRLRALDVIHGFAVPELRLKQNALPGQTLHLHVTPTVPGTYAILCTQLCGLGHYRMNANLQVLPAEEFDRWLRSRELARQRELAR